MFYEDEKKEACQEVKKFLDNPNLRIRSEELSKYGVISWCLAVKKEEIPNELKLETLKKLIEQIDPTSDFKYGDFCVNIQNWIIENNNSIIGMKIEGLYNLTILKGILDNTRSLLEYKKVLKKLEEKGVVYGENNLNEDMESFWNFKDLNLEDLKRGTEDVRKILYNIKWYNFCLDVASDTLNIQMLKSFRVTDEAIVNNIENITKGKTQIRNLIKKLSVGEELSEERLNFFDLVMKPYPLKEYQLQKPNIERVIKLMETRKFSDGDFRKLMRF